MSFSQKTLSQEDDMLKFVDLVEDTLQNYPTANEKDIEMILVAEKYEQVRLDYFNLIMIFINAMLKYNKN